MVPSHNFTLIFFFGEGKVRALVKFQKLTEKRKQENKHRDIIPKEITMVTQSVTRKNPNTRKGGRTNRPQWK